MTAARFFAYCSYGVATFSGKPRNPDKIANTKTFGEKEQKVGEKSWDFSYQGKIGAFLAVINAIIGPLGKKLVYKHS